MTQHVERGGSTGTELPEYTRNQTGWVGWVVFGAMMLILLGLGHVIVGLVSLFRDEVFAVGRNDLLVDMSYTEWGWGHLFTGAVALVVAACVLAGQLWARLLASWFALLSAMVNVAFLSAQPVLSTLMIVLDVIVIWAFLVHGGELRKREPQ